MAYRQRNVNLDYVDNLYWCAYLLFMVGDPGDTETMWRAKHINMDTACGFDAENMIGAGANHTIAYLDKHALHDISRYLRSREDLWDPSRIASWAMQRRRYFCGS